MFHSGAKRDPRENKCLLPIILPLRYSKYFHYCACNDSNENRENSENRQKIGRRQMLYHITYSLFQIFVLVRFIWIFFFFFFFFFKLFCIVHRSNFSIYNGSCSNSLFKNNVMTTSSIARSRIAFHILLH